MKKIGFIDYYLSEWHANNYPVWMREIGADWDVAYAWAEERVSPRDGVTSEEWCEKFGVTLCATIGEVCEKSDAIVILAPTDPDKHLPYAKAVFPYAKPTYIDKTFTPDSGEADEIFALAKKTGTPFFSSSALRYGTELDRVSGVRQMMTTGSGSSLAEYIIHQIEMLVKKLGCGAMAVLADGSDPMVTFHVRYADGRRGVMNFAPGMPFTVYMNGEGACFTPVNSDYFRALIADMIRFFETKEASFDPAQTLEAMKIREAALRAAAAPEQWIPVE